MTRVRLFQRDSVTRKRTRSQSTGNKRWGLISPTNKILAVFHISLKVNVAPCNKFTLHVSLFWICSFVLWAVFWYGGPGRSSRYPILEWIPLPNGLELTRWRKPKDWKKWTFAFCILQRQLCSKKTVGGLCSNHMHDSPPLPLASNFSTNFKFYEALSDFQINFNGHIERLLYLGNEDKFAKLHQIWDKMFYSLHWKRLDRFCFGNILIRYVLVSWTVMLDSGIIMWIVGAPCGNSSSRAPQRATWSHFNNIIYYHYDQNTLIFGRHVFGWASLAGLPSWENNSG